MVRQKQNRPAEAYLFVFSNQQLRTSLLQVGEAAHPRAGALVAQDAAEEEEHIPQTSPGPPRRRQPYKRTRDSSRARPLPALADQDVCIQQLRQEDFQRHGY